MTPVEVAHHGRWCPGMLERWKRDHRGWVGYTWWHEDVGLQHVEWVTADRLRPVPSAER